MAKEKSFWDWLLGSSSCCGDRGKVYEELYEEGKRPENKILGSEQQGFQVVTIDGEEQPGLSFNLSFKETWNTELDVKPLGLEGDAG